MDSQNQNTSQTSPPNFDFIMNQPGSNDLQPHEQKKFSKKVVFLAVMIVLTIIMVAVVALVPAPSENVGQQNPNNSGANPRQTADTLVGYLKVNNESVNEAAFDLLGGDIVIDKETNLTLLRRLTAVIDFTTCSEPQEESINEGTKLSYTCQSRDGKSVSFQVTVKIVNDKMAITAHEVALNA